MMVKNPPLSGVMMVKTGGVMILKNHGLQWGHVAEKSQLTGIVAWISSAQDGQVVMGATFLEERLMMARCHCSDQELTHLR